MNFNIITDYPWWFTLFCILTGIVYAFTLYYKERKFSELSIWFTRVIAFLRFTCISIIAFLLLSPLIRTVFREVEKPVIVIAQDNSESIILNKDSSFYKNEYKDNLNKLISDLSGKYDVKTYSFGNKISNNINFKFNEKQTDIAGVFYEIEARYNNRNLGGIILSSDGLYNKGSNPLYSSSKIKSPVYTIALGDTNIKKDIILSKVLYNRIAYLGNSFPLELTVDAKQLKNKSTILTVSKNNQNVFSKKLDFTSNDFTQTIPVLIEAKEPGLQRYKVKLSSLPEETGFNNNAHDIFIEILDSRQKILILTNEPHPDVAALRLTLEESRQYEVECMQADEFSKPVNQYDLVILLHLPSQKKSITKLSAEMTAGNVPVWYILGEQSSFNIFNSLQAGVNILGAGSKMNEPEAYLSNDFVLFNLSDELKRFVKDLPAFNSHFGTYKLNNTSSVLFFQKIGMVNSNEPLMLFSQQGERKTAVTCGEGLWKWRLRDFAEHGNHDIFTELVSKTVQYLSVKEDKSRFRVFTEKNFLENEPVALEAEVYNESYELVNDPEVTIDIYNSENKKFPYTFSKTTNAYTLIAGIFPVGEYKYEARVKIGGKSFSKKGEFSVTPILVESINTIADHQLLYSLAKKHSGEMLYPTDLNKLKEILDNREDLKLVSYTEKKLSDLINLKLIFFLVLLLLSLEWFLRKRNGAY